MIILKDRSHAVQIITLLLYAGEFPYYSFGMLGNERTIKNVVNKMSERQEVQDEDGKIVFVGKILNISSKGMLKTIRLNRYALPFIKEKYPDLYGYYMEHTNQHKFRGDRGSLDRNHRIAESILMLLRSGIKMLPSGIPKLQVQDRIPLSFEEPAFYHSRILKTIGKNGLKKNQYTRLVGGLFYDTGSFAVYNTRNTAMKWCGDGERKTRQNWEKIIIKNTDFSPDNSCVLFGKSYDIAHKTIVELQTNPKEEENFGQIYKFIHFVPMNEFGRKLLLILTSPDWQFELFQLMFTEEEIRKERGSFRYDALVDGDFTLSFLDSDLVKFFRFFEHVKVHHVPASVVCFQEQEEFVKYYLADEAKIRVFSIDQMLDTLNCERSGII